MNNIDSFKTPSEFSFYIEKTANDLNINYIDALLQYCEQHNLEATDINKYINSSLKDKLLEDFQNLNYFPKEPILNI